MAAITRSPVERALAWTYTGPAGHLWSVATDVATLWPRVALRSFAARNETDPPARTWTSVQ